MVGLLAPAAASAQPADARATGAARAAFEEGLRRADRGEWQDAVTHFRQSIALRDAPAVRFNLAVALARSGELVEASELARSVVADQAEGSPVEAAAALVRELAPRLAWLSLRAATPAPELRLVFDGELLAPALRGVPMPVDPGEHAVALERGGTPVVEFVIELLEGERRDLALEEPSVDAVPVAERPSVWTRWWLWTAVGVVAAGLAVGAAFVLG